MKPTEQELHSYIQKHYPGLVVEDDKPTGLRLYKTSDLAIFAAIKLGAKPAQLSIRTDSQLAQRLRDIYETVLPAQHLNKHYWSTVLCTGQVDEADIRSLIDISYRQASR